MQACIVLVGYLDDDCVRASLWLDGIVASGEGDLSFTLDEWLKLVAWSKDDECPDWFWVTTDAELAKS